LFDFTSVFEAFFGDPFDGEIGEEPLLEELLLESLPPSTTCFTFFFNSFIWPRVRCSFNSMMLFLYTQKIPLCLTHPLLRLRNFL
jgi:hypothetical protein